MRILFDHGVPVPLRDHRSDHAIKTAYEVGWSTLRNGDLLANAEKQFDVFVTTDRNLRHQQNIAGRRIAILVLPTTSWPRLVNCTAQISSAIASLESSQYLELPL